MKKYKKFYTEQLYSCISRQQVQLDKFGRLRMREITLDKIQEAVSRGANLRMNNSNGNLTIVTTSDYLQKGDLVDVTQDYKTIIRELKRGQLSTETLDMLNVAECRELNFVIFEIERSVREMMEDIKRVQNWITAKKRIFVSTLRNGEGCLVAVGYASDPKELEGLKTIMRRIMERKKVYEHNAGIQFLYEEELVNPKLVKIYASKMRMSPFMPVKSAEEEAYRIKQILRTASWVQKGGQKNG